MQTPLILKCQNNAIKMPPPKSHVFSNFEEDKVTKVLTCKRYLQEYNIHQASALRNHLAFNCPNADEKTRKRYARELVLHTRKGSQNGVRIKKRLASAKSGFMHVTNVMDINEESEEEVMGEDVHTPSTDCQIQERVHTIKI